MKIILTPKPLLPCRCLGLQSKGVVLDLRCSLFLAFHIGAVYGMPGPEALMLIRDLMEHATRVERACANH